MSKLYVPNYSQYACVTVHDSDTIRAYKTIPGNVEIGGNYTRIEYLKSNSRNTYINTGLKLNGDYKFVIEGNTNVNESAIFIDSYKSTSYRTGNIVYNKTNPRVDYWWTGVNYSGLNTDNIDLSKKFTLIQDKSSITIKQGEYENTVTYNGNNNISNDTDILIFSSQRTNLLDSGGQSILYSLKIYDNNDNLIRDYLPVVRKSDNVAGLYDNVENKFYVNVGTGEFIKGSILTSSNSQVEYVDYYFNSNYISKTGVVDLSTNSYSYSCINYSNLTDNVYYRNDFPDILITFFFLAIICFYLPTKLFFRLFSKKNII